MENKIKIKNFDELYKIAVNTEDLEGHIKILVNEIEQKIIEGIQTRLSTIIIPISHSTYHLLTYTTEDATKIVLFNIIKILTNAGYKLKLKQVIEGFNLFIDISTRSGTKLTNILNDYLNKFL